MKTKEPAQNHGSTMHHFGSLFLIAKLARDRAIAAGESSTAQREALVAVAFSAAALDSYIASLAEFGSPVWPTGLKHVQKILQAVEGERGSVRLRYMLAKALLSGGSGYEKGRLPWQDFELLVSLRNEVMHCKPEQFEWSEQNQPMMSAAAVLKKLRSRHLCSDKSGSSWMGLIDGPAVAKWACQVAAKMTQSMYADLPTGSLRTVLEVAALKE